MLWIPDFRYWITDFLTVELGLQIPIASGIPDSTSKNFPDFGNGITFHLAYTEKHRAQCEPTIPPPYTKLKLGNNSGNTRPTVFVG